jgi:copper chaperone
MITKTLSVPDISCNHCKVSIEGAVRPLTGVEEVSVDIPARTVELSFDETAIDLDQIVAAIEEAGYTVPV